MNWKAIKPHKTIHSIALATYGHMGEEMQTLKCLSFEVVESSEAHCNKNLHYYNFVCTFIQEWLLDNESKRHKQNGSRWSEIYDTNGEIHFNEPQMQWWLSKALQTGILLDKISKHKTNWTQYVDRMQRNRLQKPLNKSRTAWLKEPGKLFEETAGRI
jgi:hypothetical protein